MFGVGVAFFVHFPHRILCFCVYFISSCVGENNSSNRIHKRYVISQYVCICYRENGEKKTGPTWKHKYNQKCLLCSILFKSKEKHFFAWISIVRPFLELNLHFVSVVSRDVIITVFLIAATVKLSDCWIQIICWIYGNMNGMPYLLWLIACIRYVFMKIQKYALKTL